MKNINNLKIDLQMTYQELITLGALCKMALDSKGLAHSEYVLVRQMAEKLSTTGTIFLKNSYTEEELKTYLESKESVKN